MQKSILITGSTDGIGLETGKMLVSRGHHVLLHGRNPAKLADVERMLSALPGGGRIESYACDLSRLADVEALAKAVVERHASLDVLINNAGVYTSPDPVTQDGLDVRFAVNTIAPYLLTQRLLPLLGDVRAGDQPVLRRAISCRSGGAGRTDEAVRRRGLCAKQAGDHNVVSQHGAFTRR